MNVRELSFNAPRAAATTVSVSATSTTSADLPAGDYAFICSQDCNIVFGAGSPVATTSHWFVPAKTPFRIAGVQDGEKVAVIASATGTAWLMAI